MMNLNRSISHALKASLLTAGLFLFTPTEAAAKTETFGVGNKTFLLNGKPFIIKAAEVHYPRIPRPYWEQRIKMCKALGMNTLCLYVFWNIHEQEEGKFDFTGNNDVAEFIRLAQENGLYVIVRPGPYVCAEWEMGGLPWWLLKKKDIRLREQDPYFMERYRIFAQKLGEQIGDLTIEKGGPIIMVQVENEYGSYGEDKPYVSAIRDIIRDSGFDKVTLFQCDWSSNFTKNGLDDLVWTMNFGTGANIENEFKKLGELRPESPQMCSEFWSGWFDKWGGRHETRGSKEMVGGLKEMLDKGISFSLYMTHGGTSWGHWAGANSPGFSPDVTSYDYDAPINEAGQVTPKYMELREMLAGYSDKKLPSIPKEFPVINVPKIQFTEVAPLFENLPAPHASMDIQTMEALNQGWGSILYRTKTPAVPTQSVLTIGRRPTGYPCGSHGTNQLRPCHQGLQGHHGESGIELHHEYRQPGDRQPEELADLHPQRQLSGAEGHEICSAERPEGTGMLPCDFQPEKDRRHVPEFGNMGQRTSVRKRTRHRTLLENRSATDAIHARMLVEEGRERDYRTRHCRSAGNRGRRSVQTYHRQTERRCAEYAPQGRTNSEFGRRNALQGR